VARSLFDVAARPGHRETWVAHSLLAQRTPMPTLGFATTAFPALSVLFDGVVNQTLSTDAQDVPGIDGALADVVSGPRALAFTPDGRFAVVVDQASEDVLVVDAEAHVQRSLVRPVPGHLLEGLAMSSDGHTVYLDERGSGDVAVLTLDDAGQAQVDGAPIARLVSDPMPSQLRLGQRLFFSANSDVFPITTNHWVACATCLPEGRSDAVTWLFEEGPRDTPSNAGGTRGTGFLMRGAERRRVQDYWVTINVEQGGHFRPDDPVAQPLLDALAAFVDFGLPAPVAPATDPALVAKGKALFERADVACATCHFGPRLTDSGRGNLGLDLSGHLELHDVGTCVTTGFADAAHQDVDGNPREACQFDTPSLVGLAASPPYLHDGSAATLMDVLTQTRGKMGDVRSLNDDELAALVEYLRSL
jgi:mono/diheme cytochrome c family protein